MNYESKKNILLILSKVFGSLYSKEALEQYLSLTFENLSISHLNEVIMPFITFHKLMQLPLLISRHMYRVLTKESVKLDLSSFTNGLITLYLGSFDQRVGMIFSICDCDQNGEIVKEDMLIFLKYFHCLSNANRTSSSSIQSLLSASSSFDFIEETINEVFSDHLSLTLNQLKQESMTNSDLIMILLVYFAYTNPFMKQNVKLFGKKSAKINKKPSSFTHCLNDVHGLLSDSSDALFSYININFNEMIEYSPLLASDCDADIELLDQFEDDFHKVIDDYGSLQQFKTKFMALSDDSESFNTKDTSHNDTLIPTKHQTTSLPKSFLTKTDIDDILTKPIRTNYSSNTLTSNIHLLSNHHHLQKSNAEATDFLLTIDGRMEIKGKATDVTVSLINKDLFIFESKTIVEVINMSNYQIGLEGTNKETTMTLSNLDGLTTILLLPKYSLLLSPKKIYCTDKTALDDFISKAQVMLNQRKINNYYEFEGEIFKGENSYILKGKSIISTNTQKVAVKIISKKVADEFIIEMIETECEIFWLLKTLNNTANLIQSIDIFESANFYYFVSEYLPDGTLSSYIDQNFYHNKESFDSLVMQIVNGLTFLHSYGIIHRDLKSDNILISNEGNSPIYKITDFGLSKIVGFSERATEPCGSLCYTAPEILNQNPYTSSVDIWSLGVLLFFVWFRKFPFFDSQNNLIKITDKIKKGLFKFPTSNSKTSSLRGDNDIQRFISQCLQSAPENRSMLILNN